MRRAQGISLVVAALFIFNIASDASAQATKDEQKCIAEVNKNFGKLVKTQAKAVEGCIKNKSKGKLIGTVDDCFTADVKGKTAKTQDKAIANIAKKCGPAAGSDLIEDMFGSDNIYGDGAAAAIGEGVDKELRLMQIMFGSNVDAAILDAKLEKDAAKCQGALLKGFLKCQATKLKSFEKCKKSALKGKVPPGLATTGQELQDLCLGTGTNGMDDAKGKIAKTCVEKIEKTRIKKCVDKGVNPVDVLPGNCAASESGNVVSCIEIMIECDVCSSLNAVDGMHRDCDLFDDGLPNNSCGACRNALDQVAVNSIDTVAAICILGCAGDEGCAASCGISTTDPLCGECLADTTFCAAFGDGSACVGLCLANAQGIPCQVCLQEAGCLDCFGVAP